MQILVLKAPSLLRDGMVYVLTQGFKNDDVLVDSVNDDFSLLYTEVSADIIIIDLDSTAQAATIAEHFANQKKKVIVWTSNLDSKELTNVFKLDLNGYFYNGMEKEELLFAIQSIREGKKYIHPTLSHILLGQYVRVSNQTTNRPVGILSDREWQVLELLTKGCKNEQISKQMFISEKTVKNHVSSILKKMDVCDRTNAVLTALQRQWFFI